jgi:hypothetical protein
MVVKAREHKNTRVGAVPAAMGDCGAREDDRMKKIEELIGVGIIPKDAPPVTLETQYAWLVDQEICAWCGTNPRKTLYEGTPCLCWDCISGNLLKTDEHE